MLALDQRRDLGEVDGGMPPARRTSIAEQAARSATEAGLGRRLTEKQWAEHKRRLVEFVQTLARWDSQPSVGPVGSDTRP